MVACRFYTYRCVYGVPSVVYLRPLVKCCTDLRRSSAVLSCDPGWMYSAPERTGILCDGSDVTSVDRREGRREANRGGAGACARSLPRFKDGDTHARRGRLLATSRSSWARVRRAPDSYELAMAMP